MSTIIEYLYSSDTPGIADGSSKFANTLKLPAYYQVPPKIMVESISLSAFIATITDGSHGLHKNDQFLLSWDIGGASDSHTIVIPSPAYITVPTLLNEYIDSAMIAEGLLIDPNQPALRVELDGLTMQTVVIIDTTKLTAGVTNFTLNFTPGVTGGSQLGNDLGFRTTLVFTTATTQRWYSEKPCRLNIQGPIIDVYCNIAPQRRRGNEIKRLIASVQVEPLARSGLFTYPLGGIIPTPMSYEGSRDIDSVNFEFKTPEGKPYIWVLPYAHVVLSMRY